MRSFLSMLLLSLLVGCAPELTARPQPINEPIPLVFMAGYKPQANLPFVGVYVAQEKGFFAEEGLAVTIEHSPGQGEHLQLLAAGKIQVTTQDAAVLLQRRANPGLPLVSIALIGQRGQQAYAALADSGMQSPRDWEGKTVGYKGTPPPDLYALLAAAGVDPGRVSIVNVGFDPRLLTEGKVDVYPLFKSNEPYLIQSWGYDLTLWEAADFGVPALGLTFVTSQEILRDQPDALTRFLRAALRGIEYAEQNRDQTIDFVMKYAGPQADRDHMRFMLDSELADARSPETERHGIGWQTLEQWQKLADMLSEYQVMESQNASGAFSIEILEAARQP